MRNKRDEVRESPAPQKTRVPRLRFPEFRDAGEWEKKPLKDICERIQQGGTPDTSIAEYWNGSVYWATPAEMGKGASRFIHSTNRTITELGLQNCSSSMLPVGSVVISTRAPIGHLAINKVEIAFNQGCKGLVPSKSTDEDFLFYTLYRSKSSLVNLGAGNTFKELSSNSLNNFEVPIPSYHEQQKIADCLSSLDELIAAHAKKLEGLKAYKRGLMQLLFPAEGEKLPRLRFPEFREGPEWEEKKLLDICSMQAGKFVDPSDISEEQSIDMFPCFGGNGLRGYVSTFTHSGIFPLIGRQGALCGNIKLAKGKFHATEHAIVATPTKGIDVDWLYYLLCSLELNQHATGQAQPGLSVENLGKIPAMITSTIAEQKSIASLLTSLDETISRQTYKLETLNTHKRALMQQLFPQAEEE